MVLPSRDTVRLLLVPALAFIATGVDRGYQTDLWQHLARGRLIAAERAVVAVDRFTFTAAGKPLYDNNWLTQLVYYAVHSLAGLEGLQALNSAVLAATFAVLVMLCRRTSGSTGMAAAAGVGAFLGLWQTFLIRPQSISMLLFVSLYALLGAADRRPRLLAWAPALLALWANVHGGFAVGLALIFAFVLSAAGERLTAWVKDEGAAMKAGRSLRFILHPSSFIPHLRQLFPLLACLLVSAAATLLNPYGWNVYRYAGKLSAVGLARGVEEWMPPGLHSLSGAAFFASLVLLAILVVALKRRPTPREALLLACFALPACLSTRMTVWWFLVAAPVVARLAARPRSGPASEPQSPGPSLAAAGVCVALLTVAVLSLPWLESYNPVMKHLRTTHRLESDLQAVAEKLPAGPERMASRDGTPDPAPAAGEARARVFTRMEWANYLNWAAPDRSAVFVEGHVELYPDATWRRYLTVTRGRPGWNTVLDESAVDYLLLDATYHAALVERVKRSGGWSQRAAAGPAILFERRAPMAGRGSGFPSPGPQAPARAREESSAPTPSAGVSAGDF